MVLISAFTPSRCLLYQGNLKGALSKAIVYTNGRPSYDGLVSSGYKHHHIYHHGNEFARGKNHVNGIENF